MPTVMKRRISEISGLSAMLVYVALSASGCSGNPTEPGGRSVAKAEWFTPDIAATLGLDGRLPGARPAVGESTAINVDDARRFALAFVKAYGEAYSDSWSMEAGIRVDGTKLGPCDRIDYIESAYADYPPERTEGFRNIHGPRWQVRLCGDADLPLVEISVAANARNITVDDAGRLTSAPNSTVFQVQGVPQATSPYGSVEDAAALVAANGAGRISQPPRLIHVGLLFHSRAVSYRFVQTATNGTRTETVVFGATRDDIRIRTERAAGAEVDTLGEAPPAGGRLPVPVLMTRRVDALPKSLLARIVSPGP